MNDLPESWTTAPLSAISTDVPQRVPGETEKFTYIDIGSVDRDTKAITTPQVLLGKDAPSRARKQVAKGDTLVSMTRPNLNAVALVPPSLDGQIASTGFDVLRPLEGVDPRWLAYLVRTEQFVSAMSELVQGALYPAVRTKDVRAYVAPVAPPAEQTRIADQLDALLTRINACHHRLDAIPALLKRFRQAVLSAAVSGDLLEKPSVATFPKIALRSVLAEPLRNGKSVRDGDGLPVLRLTSLKAGGIDLSETKTGDWSSIKDVARFLVQNGDYLVSRGNGSKELVGRGGLVAGCESAIAFPDTMIRMRPDMSRLSPNYLGIVWSSQLVRQQIELAAKTTAGIWKVSQSDLENVQLPLPPLEEQARIVRRVEALFKFADQIEARHTAAVRQAQRLSPLSLAKAFRGELVQQNPQDEPASVLLQRIAGKQPEKLKTTRGRPRLKKPETVEVSPVALPDWSTLPAGAWAAQVPADEHTATAQLTAVLKAWNKPMPQDTARLATLLCLQPRLLTAALPAEHATQWRRLVGDAATPLPAQVVTLQPAFNTPWRNAISKMRARGDLVETGTGAQGTWVLGPDAARVDTVGWPEGRAGWVVHYLQTHGVEAVLPTLATEVQEFVHARAA